MKQIVAGVFMSLGVLTFSSTSALAQTVTGACCKTDNSCRIQTELQCTNFGGNWFGPDSLCREVVCLPTTTSTITTTTTVETTSSTTTTVTTSTTSTTAPGPLACRVTGGGHDTDPWDGSLASGETKVNRSINRYTFGGQAGAPGGSQPQPFGEWTHHQERGPAGSFVFHAGTNSAPEQTEVDLIVCSDPGFCNPARQAPAKQIDFEGVGAFKNIKGAPASISNFVTVGSSFHWFHVHIEDAGEGGNTQSPTNLPEADCPAGGNAGTALECGCADYYSLRIHAGPDEGSPVIYHVEGYITGGNLQIHPPLR